MDSEKIQQMSIPNSGEQTNRALSDGELRLVDYITTEATLTIEEVADWHYTNVRMFAEWDRPLARVLRFFVEDGLKPAKPKGIIDMRHLARAGAAA